MRVITPQGAAAERGKSLKEQHEGVILALETERNGYVVRGLEDRVAQVDAQVEYHRAQVALADDTEGDSGEETRPAARRGRRSAKATAEATAAAAAKAAEEAAAADAAARAAEDEAAAQAAARAAEDAAAAEAAAGEGS